MNTIKISNSLLPVLIMAICSFLGVANVSANPVRIFGGEWGSLYIDDIGDLYFNGDVGWMGGTSTVLPPKLLIRGVKEASNGSGQTLIVRLDNSLWVMGRNDFGQLGTGNATSVSTPVKIADGVKAVSAGTWHSLYLTTGGVAMGMGRNNYPFGDGTFADRYTPVQIMTGVKAISAGVRHSLYLKEDGTAWAVGSNWEGALGDGTTNVRSTPYQVMSNVVAISAGDNYSMFVKTDGSVWVCGKGQDGRLGTGDTSNQFYPVQVMTGCVDAFAERGYYNSTTWFLKSDGSVYACGYNQNGQIGDGTTTNKLSPVRVLVPNNITSISRGLFLGSDGLLWASGSHSLGAATPVNIFDLSPTRLAPTPYTLIQGSYTWAEAVSDATLRGGRLAVLNTQDKINAAYAYLSSLALSNSPKIRIGLTDAAQEGQWKWVSGDSLTISDWSAEQPSNSNGAEHFVEIWYDEMRAGSACWNDVPATFGLPYLLEIPGPIITTQPTAQAIAYGASTTLSVVAMADGTPAYQWQKDSVDLPNATSATLTLNNVQLSDAGSYTVVVTFGNSVTSDAAVVTVTPPAAWTLFNAAESALPIADAGLVTLSPIDKMSVDTEAAARSGGNALKLQAVDDSSTYAERTIQGPSVVSFAWRVSSEEGFDFFRYSIDGVVQQSITGNGSWLERSLLIAAGTHKLRWTYEKDASDSNFEDAGYLDDLVVLPAYKDLQVKSGTEVLTGSSTLSFGTVQEQAADVSQTLVLRNTGTIPMAVTASLPAGCGFIFENQSSSISITLPPGATQDLGLVLKTAVPGAKSGLLTLTAADSQTTPPAITLSGFVQALTPNIACSWSGGGLTSEQGTAVDFGTTPQDITFTISNPGTAQLAIASVSIAPTADFQVISQPAASVPVGGNTTFTLRAVETTRGTHSATVTIASNAGNAPSFSFPVTSFSYLAVTGTGYTNRSFTNTGTSAEWSTAALALPGGGTGQVLKAGSTPHGGHSTIGATFEGPGLLRWNWQTSTQANYDWLVCEVNGAEVAGISTKNAAWQSQVVQIPAGAVVRWIYRKDAANTAGSDTGYISDISFNKFSATQTTFASWSAARGDLAPLQPLHPLGLQAMFAWLGGFEPDATLAAGYYQPLVSGGTYKYRYCVAKAAAGLVQPEISYDLAAWSTRRMSQTVISEDANFAVVELSAPATGTVFSRLKAEQPEFIGPSPGMASLGVLSGYRYSSANGVSANGSVVVGVCFNNEPYDLDIRAFRWTTAEGMVDLGPGSAYAASADGSVVVGDSSRGAFRWTATAGRVALGSSSNSYATYVSADGNIVIGGIYGSDYATAFRWSYAEGIVDLGTLGAGAMIFPIKASADGGVLVGRRSSPAWSSIPDYAFRWNAAEGVLYLGLGGGWSAAYDVSADGSVVVGRSATKTSNASRAFRWTNANGIVDLGVLPGDYSSGAEGVSADGSIVVGTSISSNGSLIRAFRWSATNGLVALGTLGGDYSEANGVSADGSVVVGRSNNSVGEYRAFRWCSPSPVAPTNMALIPAGSFTMGNSIAADTDITDAPVRTVTLDAYYIGKYEVTKAEWDEVRTWALSNGYSDLAGGAGKASNHPVQMITWYDVVKWCNARSQKEGLTPVYYTDDAQTTIYKIGSVDVTNSQVKWSASGYRLPTEAEWERAARGGLAGQRFPWGDTISHSQANYSASSGYSYDLSGAVSGFHPSYTTGVYPYTSPVGAFAANSYGLYDMAGNIFEWCWDWYGTYDGGDQSNPLGVSSGASRVFRGGNWGPNASSARVASRNNFYPHLSGDFFGFRLARSSVP